MSTDCGLFVGLISGTSADAIDAALVEFSPSPTVVATRAFAYGPELRGEILALAQGRAAVTLEHLGSLDVRIGQAFGQAANALLADAGRSAHELTAIGSHGQTVRHRPRSTPAFTLQLGDPSTIAELTGITTVADFRRRDVAAGGEGAPLAPGFHAAVLRLDGEPRAVLNLGGIANLTLLPGDPSEPVRGFDTGPANCLLDAWMTRHLGGTCDSGGNAARSGRMDADALARWLDYPYFTQQPPKSTGREEFDLEWLADRGPLPHGDADVLASLTELSAQTIARALQAHAPGTQRLIACGGGVHNGFLMERIAAAVAPLLLETTREHGIDPDFVEASLFAWLARECLAGRAGNLPEVTGASGPRVLGAIYPA